jgi:DNA repair exonuclease SbcCD ATPase subunit
MSETKGEQKEKKEKVIEEGMEEVSEEGEEEEELPEINMMEDSDLDIDLDEEEKRILEGAAAGAEDKQVWEEITSDEEDEPECLRVIRRVIEVEPTHGIRFPQRVREVKVNSDEKGRCEVILAQGEVKAVANRIEKGAAAVKKVILFTKIEDDPVLQVSQFLTEEMDDKSRSERHYEEKKRLISRIEKQVKEIESMRQEIKEKEKKIVSLEQRLKGVDAKQEKKQKEAEEQVKKAQVKSEKMQKEIDELQIKQYKLEKELKKARAHKDIGKKEEEDNPIGGALTQMILQRLDSLEARMRPFELSGQKVEDLDKRMRIVEKPSSVIVQIAQPSLAIPGKWKSTPLEAWGELGPEGILTINEWAATGQCAVVTREHGERQGIQVTVDGGKVFSAGKTRIKIRLDYDPKRVDPDFKVPDWWTNEDLNNVAEIKFPGVPGLANHSFEVLKLSQIWKPKEK